MSREQEFKDDIDGYKDSLFAIIGFMNLYRFNDDTQKMRSDVLLFQGRRLNPHKIPKPIADVTEKKEELVIPEYLTPDIGILLPGDEGVIGEVKASFPEERAYWIDAFKQLMKYDQELLGWPNQSEKVKKHDIVLLVHYSRAVGVRKFYEEQKGTEINFTRPFCIIEFHRSNQSKEYFALRIQAGSLSETKLNSRLEESVQIPMIVYIKEYSSFKIYDCEPPLPYLLELIWTHVVSRKASDNPKYTHLRKNQSVDVDLTVADITDQLHLHFSFRPFHDTHPDRQPKFPKSTWVHRACERLVKTGDATWVDAKKERVLFKFVRRDDVLDYFIKLCVKDPKTDSQPLLLGMEDPADKKD